MQQHVCIWVNGLVRYFRNPRIRSGSILCHMTTSAIYLIEQLFSINYRFIVTAKRSQSVSKPLIWRSGKPTLPTPTTSAPANTICLPIGISSVQPSSIRFNEANCSRRGERSSRIFSRCAKLQCLIREQARSYREFARASSVCWTNHIVNRLES